MGWFERKTHVRILTIAFAIYINLSTSTSQHDPDQIKYLLDKVKDKYVKLIATERWLKGELGDTVVTEAWAADIPVEIKAMDSKYFVETRKIPEDAHESRKLTLKLEKGIKNLRARSYLMKQRLVSIIDLVWFLRTVTQGV